MQPGFRVLAWTVLALTAACGGSARIAPPTTGTVRTPWSRAIVTAGGSRAEVTYNDGSCTTSSSVTSERRAGRLVLTVLQIRRHLGPDEKCSAIGLRRTAIIDIDPPVRPDEIVDGACQEQVFATLELCTMEKVVTG